MLAHLQDSWFLRSQRPGQRPGCSKAQHRCRHSLHLAPLASLSFAWRGSNVTATSPCHGSRRGRQGPTSTAAAGATGDAGGIGAVQSQSYTCKRCKQRFLSQDNSSTSCRFHSALWSGGEVAKAIGFVRESAAAEHQLEAVTGRKGLLRFWDCCGAGSEDAPGCCCGFHVTFDAELNAKMGWTSPHD